MALFLEQVKTGGRCACIVPDGVLFGSSKAHQEIRRTLVEDQKLDGVISIPSGVFKPYAGVSTAVLLFTKTNSGGTDHVWFYDMTAYGYSLDDKRDPVEANDIPDVIARWEKRNPKKDKDRKAERRSAGRSRRSWRTNTTARSIGTPLGDESACDSPANWSPRSSGGHVENQNGDDVEPHAASLSAAVFHLPACGFDTLCAARLSQHSAGPTL